MKKIKPLFIFIIPLLCVGGMTFLLHLNLSYNLYYVVSVMYGGSLVFYVIRRRFFEFPFIATVILIIATVTYILAGSSQEQVSLNGMIRMVAQYAGLCVIASVLGSLSGMMIHKAIQKKGVMKKIMAILAALAVTAVVFSFHSAFYGNIFYRIAMYPKFKTYLSEIYPNDKLDMSFVNFNRLNKEYYVECKGLKDGSTLYIYRENNDFQTYYDTAAK